MDALAKGGVFLFEAFRLDRQARALFRRDEVGAFVPMAIGSRALDVLGLLVGRAPDLVSRGELIAAVWSAAIVEDTNLNMQIAALRRLLDEGRAGGSCIQTIPRRGYRFAVTVTRDEAEARGNAALRPAVDPPLATFLEAAHDQAERRPITALACELIVLSGQTDAGNLEDLREALGAFRHCISEAAARHDGFVFSSLGNMVLVLFGYPAAHENDAEQAVRAGLELCASVQTLSAKEPLQKPSSSDRDIIRGGVDWR
jgi:DNA-binding winged helix-turn-helix (wHTH) protein